MMALYLFESSYITNLYNFHYFQIVEIVQVIFGIILVAFGCFIISKWKWCQIKNMPKRFLIFAFLVKVVASFSLIGIYTYYYKDRTKADIYKYFDDGAVLESALWETPGDYFKMLTGVGDDNQNLYKNYYIKMNHWTRSGNLPTLLNDNRTIIRVNAIFHTISFHSIWIHGIYFAWLSFLGLLLLFKSVQQHLIYPKLTALLLLFMPSIWLWYSGPLKETILILGLGLFLYSYLHLKNILWRTILGLLGVFLLLNTKMYLFPIFLLLILFNEIISIWKKSILASVVLFAGLISISFLLDQTSFSPSKVIATKQADFINLAKGGIMLESGKNYIYMDYSQKEQLYYLSDSLVQPKSQFRVQLTDIKLNFIDSTTVQNKTYKVYFDQKPAASYFSIPSLDPSTFSLLKTSPIAIFNVLTRPFPTALNPFVIINFLENIIFILLLLFSFKAFTINPKWHKTPLVVSFVIAAILILLIIGWTTPVGGAIVRYKTPAMFLIILTFGMINHPWINRLKK